MITEVREYEREAFDNLPPSLKESPQAGEMDVNCASLNVIIATLDEAVEEITHILAGGNGQ